MNFKALVAISLGGLLVFTLSVWVQNVISNNAALTIAAVLAIGVLCLKDDMKT